MGQVDTIKDSGSSVLTERQPASMMGRHRIGKNLEQEFRANIERYVGPTSLAVTRFRLLKPESG